MESEHKVKHYDKHFGNCIVYWKIEDFSVATCVSNYSIHSSEFYVTGPIPTKWKFTFTPKPPNTSCVRLHLERLNDSGPIMVYVNWSLTIGTLNEDFYHSEYTDEFEKLTKRRTDMYNLSDILSSFQPFGCDTLVIHCHLIVHQRGKTRKTNRPRTLGLKWLSKDLRLIYRSDNDKDIMIKVGEKFVSAHKAILSRNAILEQLIQKSVNNAIELPDLDFTAVTRYIAFLYTGKLNEILRNPSITMYKCLEVMDKNLLNWYFAVEELKLHTKVKVEEFEHLWKIRNFSDRKKECLISPPFKKHNLDTIWQLRLDQNGTDNICCLSIYADIVKGRKPSNLCLEFAVADSEGETYYPGKILSSKEDCDLGIKEFVKTACLSETSLLADDTLNLIVRFRIWNGDHLSTTGSRMISFTTDTEDSSYEILSKSMLNMFRLGVHSDIFIQTSNTFFKAHKCVLSARSVVLSRMIKEVNDRNILTLKDINPCLLNLLLEYIYCGTLPTLERLILVLLHKAAKTYCISGLEEECRQALQSNVEKKSFGLSGETDKNGFGLSGETDENGFGLSGETDKNGNELCTHEYFFGKKYEKV